METTLIVIVSILLLWLAFVSYATISLAQRGYMSIIVMLSHPMTRKHIKASSDICDNLLEYAHTKLSWYRKWTYDFGLGLVLVLITHLLYNYAFGNVTSEYVTGILSIAGGVTLLMFIANKQIDWQLIHSTCKMLQIASYCGMIEWFENVKHGLVSHDELKQVKAALNTDTITAEIIDLHIEQAKEAIEKLKTA